MEDRSLSQTILLRGFPLYKSAQEAYRIGLVNYVVPAEQVMPKAEEIARKLAANGPIAVRKIKETVLRAQCFTRRRVSD